MINWRRGSRRIMWTGLGLATLAALLAIFAGRMFWAGLFLPFALGLVIFAVGWILEGFAGD